MPNVYAVIMAGGVGTRFWPRSREKNPKQFLEIIGKGTMIQNTIRRISGIFDPTNTLVVINKSHAQALEKQLPQLPAENIIVEPLGRNTAPAIGLAALHLQHRDPEAVMVVLPADHIIHDDEEFQRVLRLAIEVAHESHSLVTIGIKPTRPETGYGYIQFIEEADGNNPFFERGVYKVKTFAEKPNFPTAVRFIESGDFLWNSGMFIWRVDTILKEFRQKLPDLYTELEKVDAAFGTKQYDQMLEITYRIIRGISVDYGIMEKADHVLLIPGVFGWSDVGSWDEVFRLSGKDDQGNNITGKAYLKDTTNCLIFSQNKFVATIGLEDTIVISTDDAVLVCKVGQSQEVKEIADYLRRKQINEYL